MEIPDLNQMEDMQCPDCKRTLGVVIDDESSSWAMACRCGLYRELPLGAVIFGIAGPKGMLNVFRPRLAR
jgi:hypothetical protein